MPNRTYSFLLFFIVICCAGCRSVEAVEPKPVETSTIKPALEKEDLEKCAIIEVPNTFSPNGDQIHDAFKIISYCYFSKFEFTIYNRWGNLVYKTTDQFFEWNGTGADGKTTLDGTYFYACSYEHAGATYSANGNITIIR